MARRERDYAAEYARRRELAEARGFQGVREERQYRAQVRQEDRGGAALHLTGGRKAADPGGVAAFMREYQPGSMKIDQLKERIRDLLSSSGPAYDLAPLPEGMLDYEEVMDFYGSDEDFYAATDDLAAETFGGLPFDEWTDDQWDDFFESDAWYDFLDELYADK